MGAWGTGIYSNDTAADVKEICKEIFPFVRVEEGNKIIFDEYKELLDQKFVDDDYSSFWYALADWQWNHGILNDKIKKRAIELLEAHAGLADWQESASKADIKKRCAVLDKLLLKLNTPQPNLKLPKASLAKPKHKKGDIIIFKTCALDEYGTWCISNLSIGFEYASPAIRESANVLSEPFNATEKYLAILCVGAEKRLYSPYLADVYDENSVYAFYDYCDSQRPSLETLKRCGFLPNITHTSDSERRKVGNFGWAYQFTTYCSFRLNSSYGVENFESMKSFDEFERFHTLLERKPYSNHLISMRQALYNAFYEFFQEKERLRALNIEVDTLLDTDTYNPDLLFEDNSKKRLF